ncbi:hypothetical protein B9Z55_012187 [Caenorhabditis nigoni]|uniref:SCP domain-containing protein n=1 Tax=Caenorhabditis nigoni TaxID=1611254 RepID=A0A2G5TW36_9PELO|nr:hypothetical protein B9Z55_012187 [Caenorhabditis nigoni]
MKTFIVFIIILATVCLHATGTKLVLTTKEEYLKEINELRRDAAKKYKIPNMYKLFWDDKLAEESLRDNYRGIWKTKRKTYRDSDPLTVDRDLNSDLAEDNRAALVEEYKKEEDLHELEVLTPGQQKIGCIEWYKEPYKTYSFLEPEGTGISWNIPQGKPGSDCAQGFENDDGLCSPEIKPTPTGHVTGTTLTRTTKEEYLKDLNELRRSTAKKYRIPNMYELFRDNAVAEEALVTNKDGFRETKRRTFPDSDPFTEVRNLDSDLAFDNRSALIDEFKNSDYMSELEVITPGQQRIGCVPWYQRQYYNDNSSVYYYTYCFLKPDGSGNSWDMKLGEPGSACAQGFENNDGLCSPGPPTTPMPEPTTPKPKIPHPKIVGPKPTAPPKASRLLSDFDSEPDQVFNIYTDGACYGEIGMTLILVFFMIF